MKDSSGCGVLIPQLLILITVATLFAAGLFLAIPYLQGRPEFPAGTTERYIEGNLVRITMNPEQEVFLIPVGNLGTGGELIAQLASPTPVILPTVASTATTQPLPSAPPPPPATVTPIPRNSCIAFTAHRVQSGDTLYNISRRYVTSIALMARHGISSTSLIVGETISVPVGEPSCCTGGWRPYVVGDGDTWSGIAATSGISTDLLLQTNGQPAGAILYLTSVICIP